MSTLHPIISDSGNHSALGQMLTLRNELIRRTAVPSSAKKEDDRRKLFQILTLGSIRLEHLKLEFDVVDLFVGINVGAFNLRRIGSTLCRDVRGGDDKKGKQY